MLRRHPTSIAITTHDLAIFEKLYAQRGLYTDHRESGVNGDGYGEDPTGFGVSGVAKWAGKAARSEAGLEGEARDEADREERRIKSTQQRIQGIAAAAAGAGAGAGGASVNGSGSGGGGRGTGQTQQRR